MTRRPLLLLGAAVLVLAGGAFGGAILRSVTDAGAAAPPHFTLEGAAGISQRYDGGATFSVGGGVAVFDCNGDGRPDLFLAGGTNPAALYRNDGQIGGPLHFTAVNAPEVALDHVSGAYPIDIDSDGITDLVVLRAGESVILRGLGNCRFQRANESLGFDGAPGDSTAFSATWESGATWPTLAFGHYLGLNPDATTTADCASSALYRPVAGSHPYAVRTDLRPGYCALSMLFSDWNRSGHQDLRVTNDRNYYVNGSDQLWQLQADRPPRLYTAADGWVPLQIFGMGIASQDVTGDGLPEVYLTSQGDNKLQTLAHGPAQPAYVDIALQRGVTAAQPFVGGDVLPSTAWHPEFADVNNDGHFDLFVSKGNVNAQPDYAKRDPSNLFIGQADGSFVEGAVQAGIVSYAHGRGAALADFNMDGLLDLVVVNYGADVMLWRNVGSGSGAQPGSMGHWAAVRLAQDGPNRDAIGAWLETRLGDQTIQREVTVGGGHLGGQLGWLHLGLGSATSTEVQVRWPDGSVGPWMTVGASEFAIITRGAATPQRWLPGSS